jgi:hypothetical protein
MSINTQENIKLQSTFFDPCMCHINPPPSAQWRLRLPHDAQKHPQGRKILEKKCLRKGEPDNNHEQGTVAGLRACAIGYIYIYIYLYTHHTLYIKHPTSTHPSTLV